MTSSLLGLVPLGTHRCLHSSLPGHLDLAELACPWGRTCSCSQAMVAASKRPHSLLDGDLQHGQGFFPWSGYFMPSAELCGVALSINLTPCPASQPMAKFPWVTLASVNPLPRLSCCFSPGQRGEPCRPDDGVGCRTCSASWKPGQAGTLEGSSSSFLSWVIKALGTVRQKYEPPMEAEGERSG